LRKEIGSQAGNFKIATNFSVHGYRKKGTINKTQMMPDIVILDWQDELEKPRIKLMIELKIMLPDTPTDLGKKAFRNVIDSEFLSDFRKLNYALERDWVGYGYFVYLYHSPKITERTMESLIKKTKLHQTNKIMFKPIAINKFQKKISNKHAVTRGMIKSHHKARQLYSSYPRPTDDPDGLWVRCKQCDKLEKTHTIKDCRKCGLSIKEMPFHKRSAAALKAHGTRKKMVEKKKASTAAKKAARTRKRNAADNAKKRAAAARRRKRKGR
jgi:hypothetical protein